MTAFFDAMVQAGIPVPTKQLPAIPQDSVRSQLSALESAGCIYSKGTKRAGSVKAYYTDMDTYVYSFAGAKLRTPLFDLDKMFQ